MINKLFLILFLILPVQLFANNETDNTKSPVSADDSNAFVNELAKDNSLIQNSNFLYNFGTYYLEKNQASLASIYLLKSIAKNPLQKDVFDNLAIARDKINQDLAMPNSFYRSLPESFYYLPMYLWFSIPLLFLIFFLVLKIIKIKNPIFLNSFLILSAVFFILSISFSLLNKNTILGALNPIEVKAGPGENFPNILSIPTGSLVNLEEMKDDWIKISFVLNQKNKINGWAESKLFLPIH
ncbi:MAG: hypothetical protein M9962_04625 [Oligoflexia bacterium]|nr:hypothetical protein [Oligoflexia bacterium]